VTRALRVAGISTYLAATGWRFAPETWRGAWIWSLGDAEVLVPPHDDLGDGVLRIREVLDRLADVEARDTDDIARSIASPLVDSTTYRALPEIASTGGMSLTAGARAVHGIRRMLGTAARTVVEGPLRAFSGPPPAEVSRLLGAVRPATGRHDDFALTLMIPLTPFPELGRSVTIQLYDAVSAVEEAVEHDDDPASLDSAAAVGVSVGFCEALSDLAGNDRRDPFQLDFRWAPAMPIDLPGRVLSFPPHAGARIRQASRRLGRLDLSGPATVLGRVESLHDDPDGRERWRVRIRGELNTERTVGSRRGIWVRLHGPRSYDLAITAHREHREVRVTGFREGAGTRQDLAVPPDGLEILDHHDLGPVS